MICVVCVVCVRCCWLLCGDLKSVLVFVVVVFSRLLVVA